jgi:hypothetical protein
MMFRRSLAFAVGAIATMSWSVWASDTSNAPPAVAPPVDQAARQQFVSLLTSGKSTILGSIEAHDLQGDLRAFGGGGGGGDGGFHHHHHHHHHHHRPPSSPCKP